MSDLKTVKTFNTRIEAELAKGLLEANEIQSMLLTDDGDGVRPHFTLIHGVKLQVNEGDFKKATEVLENK